MHLCEYGCGQEAIIQFKNGKWCCSERPTSCPEICRKRGEAVRGENNGNYHREFTQEHRNKLRKANQGKTLSEQTKKKISDKIKVRIRTDEHNKKLAESNRGKKRTKETCIKISQALKGKYKGKNNKSYGIKKSEETKRKISEKLKGRILSKEEIIKRKITISKILKRYSIFSKIEEMRYNPDKPEEKEIQVHCKNHNCQNSKEQVGWFTPTRTQLYERIRQIEYGEGGCYFYCTDECKNICPLFNLHSDPFKVIEKSYTTEEYESFRKTVLERDNYICQYCGELAEHVHHERPKKLEPFFALDIDLAWSVCKECHYKYGHKDECSTGNLAKRSCK